MSTPLTTTVLLVLWNKFKSPSRTRISSVFWYGVPKRGMKRHLACLPMHGGSDYGSPFFNTELSRVASSRGGRLYSIFHLTSGGGEPLPVAAPCYNKGVTFNHFVQ